MSFFRIIPIFKISLNLTWSLPYLNRVRDKELPEFEHAKELFFYHVISEVDFQAYVSCALAELEAYMMTPFAETHEAQLMFLTKFVFSSLIDADRTNTRLFEENKTEEPSIDHKQLFDSYYGKLMEKIRSFESNKHGNNRHQQAQGRDVGAMRSICKKAVRHLYVVHPHWRGQDAGAAFAML